MVIPIIVPDQGRRRDSRLAVHDVESEITLEQGLRLTMDRARMAMAALQRQGDVVWLR